MELVGIIKMLELITSETSTTSLIAHYDNLMKYDVDTDFELKSFV